MKNRHELLLLLAAALFAAVAAPCAASSVRGEVFLDNDTITVGDLFNVTGDVAAKPVTAAPAPGRKAVYDVSALTQIARTFNIDWKPAGNYDRVTITRASQTITTAMIRDKVIQGLATLATQKDLDVALDNQNMEINRPTGIPYAMDIADLRYDPVRYRFTGNLMITEPGRDTPASVVTISGRAMPMVKVPMLVRTVQAGETLRADDLEWTLLPIDKTGADAVSDMRQLEGTEMRRAVSAQTILRTRDLSKARMIAKGSLVMMQVTTPSMQLTAQGRALSDGVMGETIRVTNTQSNRTIDAVIIGKDKVSVIPVTATTVAAR